MKPMGLCMLSSMIGAIVASAFMSRSMAQIDSNQLTSAIHSGQCKVDVGVPRISGPYQCDENTVVTSILNGYLYCSTIKVTCN